MSMMVLLEGKAKADAIETLKTALPTLFPDTRAYEGCEGITAYVNGDGRTVVFVEYWETQAHYERYLAWRTETGAIANLASMLEAPPSIRHFGEIAA